MAAVGPLWPHGPGSRRRAAHGAQDNGEEFELLAQGIRYEAIATQLRVSHRTVQRRITALMQRAGATTRTQLVWQAARRDWLS
ncbi:helix-turn-helix domain-containing protein [Streptomyces sp. Ncost-T10-10d]|uniref:helix-turn-helix domain-containing protein n=1 Tax=Streptomyces sp. Ncost-T10-10d TaxID=1839774 RepID=UPI0035225621